MPIVILRIPLGNSVPPCFQRNTFIKYLLLSSPREKLTIQALKNPRSQEMERVVLVEHAKNVESFRVWFP